MKENSSHGTILVNEKGVICSIELGVAKLFHVKAGDVLGHRLTEIYPSTRLLEVLVSQEALRHEELLNHTKVQVSYYPITCPEIFSGVVIILEAFQTSKDIKTVKEDSDQELIALYEGILTDLPIGFAVVNRQGRVVFINDEYSQVIGCSTEEFQGLPLRKYVPFTQVTEVIRTTQPRLQVEVNFRGKSFWLTETPILSQGQPMGALSKILARDRIEGQNLRNLNDRIQVLENKLLFYKEELLELRGAHSPLENIQGESAKMRKLKQVAERVAVHDANILITGESGTGKGLLAATIHQLSPRKEEPFISINCAAIPENLLESELFGYEEGAFTGALKGGKPGKFELAQGGTIFLDEIGDMPLTMQAKILRILQEKSFERIGGTKTINVDVRVIAATNRDLPKLIDEGRFRLDIYYRLAVINLTIPPLRERPEDIPHLCLSVMKRLSLKYHKSLMKLSPAAENNLLTYPWPGNVRELENVLEYAFNFLEDGESRIDVEHLPNSLIAGNKTTSSTQMCTHTNDTKLDEPMNQNSTIQEAIAQAEIQAIKQALTFTKGNKQAAARVLGIHISGLYQKLKKYSL